MARFRFGLKPLFLILTLPAAVALGAAIPADPERVVPVAVFASFTLAFGFVGGAALSPSVNQPASRYWMPTLVVLICVCCWWINNLAMTCAGKQNIGHLSEGLEHMLTINRWRFFDAVTVLFVGAAVCLAILNRRRPLAQVGALAVVFWLLVLALGYGFSATALWQDQPLS